MIKHQHNEFQSDVFLLFETLQAKLTILETGGVSKVIGLIEFLRTDMTKKLITQLTLPAYAKDEFVFDSYKVKIKKIHFISTTRSQYFLDNTTCSKCPCHCKRCFSNSF